MKLDCYCKFTINCIVTRNQFVTSSLNFLKFPQNMKLERFITLKSRNGKLVGDEFWEYILLMLHFVSMEIRKYIRKAEHWCVINKKSII